MRESFARTENTMNDTQWNQYAEQMCQTITDNQLDMLIASGMYEDAVAAFIECDTRYITADSTPLHPVGTRVRVLNFGSANVEGVITSSHEYKLDGGNEWGQSYDVKVDAPSLIQGIDNSGIQVIR